MKTLLTEVEKLNISIKHFARTSLSLIVSLVCISVGASVGMQEKNIRPAAVAGQFYPSNGVMLKLAIQKFISDAVPATVENPLALVVPHAGYIFSGQIGADAYRQVSGRHYDVVVILGTNHTTAGFNGISLYPKGAYQTPLGSVQIEESIPRALMSEDSDCVARPDVQEREHSVEVQVPFVQVLFPAARIVPVVVGTEDLEVCSHFGQSLARAIKGREVLIVASSDLSHYPSYEDAIAVDRLTLEAIVRLDPMGLSRQLRTSRNQGLRNLVTCACGEPPVLAAIVAAKALGATRGVVLSYANSGDTAAGDRARVVGYGAVALAAGSGPSDIKALNRPQVGSPSVPLQPDERKALLAFARETLNRLMTTDTTPLARGFSPRLQCPQGAFVTLKKHGELRGCIGQMAPEMPLVQTIGAMAVQAALNDRRFSPVKANELKEIEIEISVLTPMQRVSGPSALVIGRDGVVLQKGDRSAVFLPQVAVEQGWNREQWLDNLCLKAGLLVGAWRKDSQFLAFQADVFGEKLNQ
jgi:MEMO1 family protein